MAVVGIMSLSACAPSPEPESTPTATPSVSASVTRAPTPTPTPDGPVFIPDGTAAENLPVFTDVVESVWASDDRAKGRSYVDALVKTGFDKSAMQVTNDETTVGNPAESIQFSVFWQGECLVGQVGPATGDPVAAVLPALQGETCLIGQTRTIDW